MESVECIDSSEASALSSSNTEAVVEFNHTTAHGQPTEKHHEDASNITDTERDHFIDAFKPSKPMCQFYLEGKCRFGEECFNKHPSGFQNNKNNKKGSPETNSKQDDGRPKLSKKPPLKTAGDVMKRLLWDSNLQKEYFTVGYLDRFVGVVEKPFTAFSWEHLALVDLDQLAIPQHRIQFFKYKGTVVWDKNQRLDNVFGSAGNTSTIQKEIERVEEEIATRLENGDDSDTDEDDIVFRDGLGEGSGCVSLGGTSTSLPLKPDERPRSTHFICIRVLDQEVCSKVKLVQDAMVIQEPELRSCAMPQELLHITMAMIKCETTESILAVSELLGQLQSRIKNIIGEREHNQEQCIHVKGLSTFGARVLYAKLEVPASFRAIIDLINESIRDIEDVSITNNFEFVPHMTLMKVSRPVAKERRSKYLNSSLYSAHLSDDFGRVPLKNLHFCVINDHRGPDGFYLTCTNTQI